VKLLDRLYDVARGRVLVDGVDVREWEPQALRRRIAVVLQDVFLFSGSVHANIGLGREEISREVAETAARHVNAEAFVRRLGGSDALVRERGSNLSGGQRQLLAFARALAHDPTSSSSTRRRERRSGDRVLIQDALAKLLRGRTSVVIAHRLSTIEHADRILVLHKGELREEGRTAISSRGWHLRATLPHAVRVRWGAPGPRGGES